MTLAEETVADTTAHAAHHLRPHLERLSALTTSAARALPDGALMQVGALPKYLQKAPDRAWRRLRRD
ncbi:hypothetical protein [Streptomyces sp. DvalAA-19]|uniref:hypothetical protein n=1 Tax=Streptomyces sp. DvalAA-19 TaxID=1839761 RepID=UPI00081B6925|nr:hypothetical protein [Streptomyces sp. DvalAA-19]SCE09207.1 hypothetical protein GA0115244_116887 [Streptomyces sp. DvalAA-19]